MSLAAGIVVVIGVLAIALSAVSARYAWVQGKRLLAASDATSALVDVHAEASGVRSAEFADAAESVSRKALSLGEVVASISAGVRALSMLSGEIGRTRSQARWSFLHLVFGHPAPGKPSENAAQD
jgi:hypothetical protein